MRARWVEWISKQYTGKSFRLSLVFQLLLILVKYLVVAHIPYYHFVFLLVSVWFYCLRTKVSLRYGCFNGLNRVFGKIMLKISKFTKNFKKPKNLLWYRHGKSKNDRVTSFDDCVTSFDDSVKSKNDFTFSRDSVGI